MMDETQAQKVLADATAPPMPGPGQLVDPPEVARYAQRGDPPISEWPGRAVTRKDRSLPKKQRHTAKRIYAPESRARLRRQVHDSQGLRARASPPDTGDVRPAVPSCRRCPVRLRPGQGGPSTDWSRPSTTSCWTFPTATHASSRPTPQRRPRRSATVTSRPSRSWVACPGASSTTTRDWPWPGSWETTGGSVPASSRSSYPTTCSRSGSAGETLDPMRPVERFSGVGPESSTPRMAPARLRRPRRAPGPTRPPGPPPCQQAPLSQPRPGLGPVQTLDVLDEGEAAARRVVWPPWTAAAPATRRVSWRIGD